MISHHICLECYDREIQPISDEQRWPKTERLKPPLPEFDWFDFLKRHMYFSLAIGALFVSVTPSTS